MISTQVDLPYIDTTGHARVMHAFPSDEGGWDVMATLDDGVLLCHHRDWQHVERLRSLLSVGAVDLHARPPVVADGELT